MSYVARRRNGLGERGAQLRLGFPNAPLPVAEFHTAWASSAATPLKQLIDETLHAAGA